jgi:hypothetical protein
LRSVGGRHKCFTGCCGAIAELLHVAAMLPNAFVVRQVSVFAGVLNALLLALRDGLERL